MELSEDKCTSLLEKIRWNGIPKCPYCESTRSTPIKNERRYHCNSCFNSYSVTIGTLFHGSRVPLSKWFSTIHLYLDVSLTPKKLGIRFLAKEICVNKNTAASMLKRIRSCIDSDPNLLIAILHRGSNSKDESE